MPARKCRYKTTGLLICLMLLYAVPGSGYMLQDKKVLVVEFEKQGTVPDKYMRKIKSIMEQRDNVVWQPFVVWDTRKRFDRDQDYLEEENISHIIEGKIIFDGENVPNKIDIVLLDSLQQSIENFSVNFREFKEMERNLAEVVKDILYYIKHKKSRRKVFIVKFKLEGEMESGDKDEVELVVPKSIESKLRKDDQLSNAYYFDFTRKEFDEWMNENDDSNILKGDFEPFFRILPDDTLYFYNIDVQILFFQTQEDKIGISMSDVPNNAGLVDRLAQKIVQRLKELMVSQQEVEL